MPDVDVVWTITDLGPGDGPGLVVEADLGEPGDFDNLFTDFVPEGNQFSNRLHGLFGVEVTNPQDLIGRRLNIHL